MTMPMPEPLRYFIGYDAVEDEAYQVCVRSLMNHAGDNANLRITRLSQEHLRDTGVYWRPNRMITNRFGNPQHLDLRQNELHSTGFTYTRWLIPYLCDYAGWALFTDLDFMWRANVEELWDLRDDRYALMCVKHEHAPPETIKMWGITQDRYRRKNWSSMMLVNAGHPANRALSPAVVSSSPRKWFHQFSWLADELIGAVPEEWNWLEGHSSSEIDPKVVHHTRGLPTQAGHEDVAYADEWLAYWENDVAAAHP